MGRPKRPFLEVYNSCIYDKIEKRNETVQLFIRSEKDILNIATSYHKKIKTAVCAVVKTSQASDV